MPLALSNNSEINNLSEYVELGQIYNLDDDKKIFFQYNPEEFEDSLSLRWADIQSIGQPSMHHQYLGQTQRSFELSLIYMADGNLPPVKTQGNFDNAINGGDLAVDFDALYRELLGWLAPRPDTGIPSYLMIIIGRESYTGFIRELRKRITLQYPDGRSRRGILTFQFQEWRTFNATLYNSFVNGSSAFVRMSFRG